jgi:hypothetical protein
LINKKIAGVETESTTTEDSVELFWADKSIESPDGDNKATIKYQNLIVVKYLWMTNKTSGEVKRITGKTTDVIRGGQKFRIEETLIRNWFPSK